ncbi:hypothetical protein FNV43_RR16759 [Rhamnella rubrinervis]|uniref:Uncharacterized protein n=1 Tax=Rhamnella rubrinervis TaxID=2594499 RepID=A0A8K0GZF1_9ROSA|nr:hypothetical protein FNV43_RR16759 [Rhamnella rubrinervis]
MSREENLGARRAITLWRSMYPASSSRVECKEIGESEDACEQELERKKLEVAKFFSGFTTAVPLSDKRAWFVDSMELDQFQRDHSYQIYRWDMDQHQDDPDKQEGLNAHLEHIGVEIPRVPEACAVGEDPEEEEDLEEKEDLEEFSTDV